MRRLLLILPIFLLFACPSPQLKKLTVPPLSNSAQIVLVVTPDGNATEGQLSRFEKNENGEWSKVGKGHPVTVGRNGLAWGRGLTDPGKGGMKKEGDGKAPAGIFRITKIFGYEPPLDLSFKMPFLPASETLECVDDSGSVFYNQLIDSLKHRNQRDWKSSERMRRPDHQYRWGAVVEHNGASVPQGGSCIFLHIWKEVGRPTSGCTAMSEEDLLKTLFWLDRTKGPVLVQLTQADFEQFRKKGILPKLE